MTFKDASISFHSSMTAACSQFEIHTESPIHMTLSGPSRYTYLKLDSDQTHCVNALAKKVGLEHESGPTRNRFMVYSETLIPGTTKVVDSTFDASAEEKRVFEQIFEMAAASIATQMGLSVSTSDVTKIVLEKNVDFNFIEAQRACSLSIEISQPAAEKLNIDKDTRFREYCKGSGNNDEVMMVINPGQFKV
ncbi:MAG: hypothetical protein JHC93_04245 [Parachlamydiales bacterium]|nr:hypothetical protein [Parachlamydiales bacterium]